MAVESICAETARRLIQPVVSLAEEAGELIMAVYSTDFEVKEKSDESPLTAADMAAHQTIVAGLEELTPDIPILSEESAAIPYGVRREWDCYWLIDPLDGTREFIKRNGEFTVNIALISHGKPIMGVVHVPVTGINYFAAQGDGAFKQINEECAKPIRVRKAAQPLVVAGSRSHAGKTLKRYLDRLGPHELLSVGSSLKSCMVAEGEADLYPRLGPTSEWDTAAAQCVVEEAGGQITDTQMRPLRYNTKESLLNPHFFVFGDASRDWSRYLEEDAA